MKIPSLTLSDKQWNVLYIVLVGVGLMLAFSTLGSSFKDIRKTERVVTVKGLAEKDVKADTGIWTIAFSATDDDLQGLQIQIEEDKQRITTFLTQEGFKPEDIQTERLEVVDHFAQRYRDNDNPEKNRFSLTSYLIVRTSMVDQIQTSRGRVGELVKQGVVFADVSFPVGFLYTRLNDIKPEMIAEATKNARKAAEQFAKDSESNLGKIRSASQGMFSIIPRDDMGNESESSQIEKKVRVVSTVEYFLED